MHGSDLPPIKFKALAAELLARAPVLVPQWLPGGKKRGPEYTCGSLAGGKGDSLSVNLTTGMWADFASEDKGGDLISLYAAIHGLDMGRAAVQVARDYGLEDVAGVTRDAQHSPKPLPAPPPPPVKQQLKEKSEWQTVRPVPEFAKAKLDFNHLHYTAQDIEHVAEYRVGDELHGYVVRFRRSDGGKLPLQRTWCTDLRDGASRWHWKHWDEPRPLYLPSHEVIGTRTVVLVEGEKKADVLQALLDVAAPGVYCVVGWPGGCKAWQKVDWAWLKGCTVLLWPDCDSKREPLTRVERAELKALPQETPDQQAALALRQAVLEQAHPLLPEAKQPGMAAMLGIGALLRDEQGCTVSQLPIPKPGVVPDGWDARDAIETDGWDGAAVLAFFAKAQPLPAQAEGDALSNVVPLRVVAGGGGGGKKTDGPVDTEGDGSGGGGSGGGGSGDGAPWWLQPYWNAKKQYWMVSRKLVIAALVHDEALAGILGVNLLSNNIEARRPWPWLHAKAGPITGAIDLQLGQYLSRQYGLPSIARQALGEAIETVAHENPFHPFREYLAGLQHDDKPRIDKWLIHALGEDPETMAPSLAEYLALVGRFILLGIVNRVMQPGCKFDYMPVLEGPGGFGKSTFVEVLVGSGFYSDTHFDVSRGKDGQEQVQGLVGYEIAELANFSKSDRNLIKAFVSAKVDRYRPSYGRVVESYPRQCVMFGTTNNKKYLTDRTGNRRFWPIPVPVRIRLSWLGKWRDQLFAEAYKLYRQGERFNPTPEEETRLFVPMQESRLVETAVMGELLHVLTRPSADAGWQAKVNDLTNFVTLAELVAALGVDAAKSTTALEGQIRDWMEHEGWEYVKKQINGVRRWGYARPPNWPPADAQPSASAVGDMATSAKVVSSATSTAAANVTAGQTPSTINSESKDDEPF